MMLGAKGLRAAALVLAAAALAGTAEAGLAFVSRVENQTTGLNDLCLTVSNEFEPDPYGGYGLLFAKPCAPQTKNWFQVFDRINLELKVRGLTAGLQCVQPESGAEDNGDIPTFGCTEGLPGQHWSYRASGVLEWGIQIASLPACMRFFPGVSNGGGVDGFVDMVRTSTACATTDLAVTWDKVTVPDCATGKALEFLAAEKLFECVSCAINTKWVDTTAGAYCEPCVEGTFTDSVGSQECSNCIDSNGACEACPLGTALDYNAGCVECAAGSFSNQTGLERCHLCAPGSAQANPASESCQACLPGFVQPLEGQGTCSSCPAGESNNANRTICEACAPGTFAKTSGSACNKCPAGQYQDGTGATSCKPCGKGEYSAEGQDKCTPCPVGTFNDEGGSGECTKCPAGSIQTEEGKDKCTPCGSGEASNEAATECAPCPAGSFAEDGACIKCPAGSFSEESGASICNLCDEGFSSEEGGTECKPCEEGVTTTRGAVCELCPKGQKPNAERRRCQLCDEDDTDKACLVGSDAHRRNLAALLTAAAAASAFAQHL